MADLSTPYIEGIYELQLPLAFLVVGTLGCLAGVNRGKARQLKGQDTATFQLPCCCSSSIPWHPTTFSSLAATSTSTSTTTGRANV